jgi:hypothetical protein
MKLYGYSDVGRHGFVVCNVTRSPQADHYCYLANFIFAEILYLLPVHMSQGNGQGDRRHIHVVCISALGEVVTLVSLR